MSDVALISGGANGIGRAVALKLAAGGISVIIADREEAAGEEVRRAILAAGGKAEMVQVDVTKAGEIEAVVGGVFQGTAASISWRISPAAAFIGKASRR